MLDSVLAICLIGLAPAYGLWRSRGGATAKPETIVARLSRTVLLACGLLALLVAAWKLGCRPVSDLGLSAPTNPAALIGLCLAVAVLSGLGVAMTVQIRTKKATPQTAAKAFENLPRTWGELAIYLPAITLISVAWELLYRGFLLWFLTPRLGVYAAVALSATVYALAHPVSDLRRLAASLVSALLFTTGYALTQSLWWLMLLHAGFPILGSLASLYLSRFDKPPRDAPGEAQPARQAARGWPGAVKGLRLSRSGLGPAPAP